MSYEKNMLPSICSISNTINSVLSICIPELGLSPNMTPGIKSRMLTILKREQPVFLNISVEQIVFYLMIRAVKELRVPCRSERSFNTLRRFNEYIRDSESIRILGIQFDNCDM